MVHSQTIETYGRHAWPILLFGVVPAFIPLLTLIRANAQDTRSNPNSRETHLVRKRWDIGLLPTLSPGFMMMMMTWSLPQCRHISTTYVPAICSNNISNEDGRFHRRVVVSRVIVSAAGWTVAAEAKHD